MCAEPRGMRNNNPLNIRYEEHNEWVGQIGHDKPNGGMCVFSDIRFGYRAAFKLLNTYQKRYKCNNIAQLITKWAPPSENNTVGYIKRVCDIMHCEKEFVPHFDAAIDYSECITLLAAMASVENAVPVHRIDFEPIEEAHKLAFGWAREKGGA